jgi:hypothetical protein
MPHLRYEFARLQRDYYLNRVSERFQKKRKLPPPSYVLWDSTRRCNLGCLHCGATKETYTQELTTEQIQHVIDELADLKVRMFSVTGGEPLLRQDLLQVLAHARNQRLPARQVNGQASSGSRSFFSPSQLGRIGANPQHHPLQSIQLLQGNHGTRKSQGVSYPAHFSGNNYYPGQYF